MINRLLKTVMAEFGLKQTDLAELLEVPLHRVKSLTSGKVHNLKREEGEALIKRLNIRGDWLATGEGPMRQSDREVEFHRRLEAVKTASAKASGAGLSGEDGARLSELLYYHELGDLNAIHQILNPLNNEESLLVQYYRACTSEAKKNLLQTAALLSAGLASGAGEKVQAKVSKSFLGFASASTGGNKRKP